jgi:hypothetical protein
VGKKNIVLTISDLHCPFQHPAAFDFLNDLRKEYKPTKIICLGDEADFAGISFHKKNPDMPSPGDEYKKLIASLKPLFKLFPKVEVCTSNHTSRPYRMAFDVGLPSVFVKSYREFLGAPRGWSWHNRIRVDGVYYDHGEMLSGRDGAYKGMLQLKSSFVCGHLHSHAGVTYSESPDHQSFAMNSGCLIDPNHTAFSYSAKMRNKASLGTGIVIEGVEAIFRRLIA